MEKRTPKRTPYTIPTAGNFFRDDLSATGDIAVEDNGEAMDDEVDVVIDGDPVTEKEAELVVFNFAVFSALGTVIFMKSR